MAALLSSTNTVINVLSIHIIIFFLIPYLPDIVLISVDYFIVRALLLVVLLASTSISPITGVSSFILIAYLFVKRNNLKMKHLESLMQQSSPTSEAIESIVTPETAPEQPNFDIPTVQSIPFMPQEDSGENTFEPVAESMNQKQPLPTEESNQGVEKSIQQLYGWVNPKLAQAP
jgi:hypothetical protein